MLLKYRYYIIATLLTVCVFFESLAYTYMQEQGEFYYYSSSLIYFFCGIAICVLPFFYNGNNPHPVFKNTIRISRLMPVLFFLFIAALGAYHLIYLNSLYSEFPISIPLADMIPTIQLACKRFLSGQTVYGPAPEIKPTGIIPYLPMMWLPFLPSEVFGFDARWTTVIALFFGLFIAAIPLWNKKILFLPMAITGVSLFLLLNFFLMKYHNFWGLTEEALVAGFYLILGFSLLRKNYWLIGFAITCCILSRYSLLLWVPVYFGYVFFTQSRNNFWKLFASFTVSISLLFVIPFFIRDPMYFIHILPTYSNAFHWFWQNYHLTEKAYHCVGMFKFFSIDQIGLMSKLYIAMSFIAPLIFVLITGKLQKRYQLDNKYIAFGSLKISLIFFYNFIPAPYLYLFFPATVLSYALAFEFISMNKFASDSVQQQNTSISNA